MHLKLKYFSPQFSNINFLVSILYSFLDYNTEIIDWKDIINNYNDDDLDKLKIEEPIVLSGIHSKVLNYLLDFSKELSDFKKNNPHGDLSLFSYNKLRIKLEDTLKIDIKYSIQLLQGIFYLDINTEICKARNTWLINLIVNHILDKSDYQEGRKFRSILKKFLKDNNIPWWNKFNQYKQPLIEPQLRYLIEYRHYTNINNWNVSRIKDMSTLFENKIQFNENIGNWDVSNVEDMSFMFNNARNFNKYIGKWDVKNVKYMSFMFNQATNFIYSDRNSTQKLSLKISNIKK